MSDLRVISFNVRPNYWDHRPPIDSLRAAGIDRTAHHSIYSSDHYPIWAELEI